MFKYERYLTSFEIYVYYGLSNTQINSIKIPREWLIDREHVLTVKHKMH